MSPFTFKALTGSVRAFLSRTDLGVGPVSISTPGRSSVRTFPILSMGWSHDSPLGCRVKGDDA